MKIHSILLVLFLVFNSFIFGEALTPEKGSNNQSGDVTDLVGDLIESSKGDKFTYVEVKDISLDDYKDLQVNESYNFKASVLPKTATNPAISFSTLTPDILSVDISGNVLGLKAGEGIVRITSEDNKEIYRDIKINVSPKPIVAIEEIKFINPLLTMYRHSTQKLITELLPKDTTQTNLEFSSSNESVAIIRHNTIYAYEAGLTTIMVNAKDNPTIFTSFELEVLSIDANRPSKIEVDLQETYYVNRYGTIDIQLIDENGNIMTNEANNEIAIEVNALNEKDEKIANYVAGSGLQATKKGRANIQVCSTFDRPKICSETKQIEVLNVQPTNITINANWHIDEFKSGASINLTYSFTPSDVTNKEVVWSVDNDNAKISQTGVLVGLKQGEVIVSLTHLESNFVATRLVTIKKASSLTLDEYNALHLRVRKLIGHFGLFVFDGILGYAMIMSDMDESKKRKWLSLVVIGFSIGIVAELLQLIPYGRVCTITDMIINCSGFFVGTLLVSLVALIHGKIKKDKQKKV